MADRAFQHVGERVYVEGVPFGGWIETGDCYTSDAPLWEGDIDLVATVEALTARLDAAHNVIRRVRKGWDEMDEWVWSLAEAAEIRAATADPTPQTDGDDGT